MDNKKALALRKMRNAFIRIIIAAGAFTGIYLTMSGGGSFMSSDMLLYFTIESNIWIALICLLFVFWGYFTAKGRKGIIPALLHRIKFICTVSIALTFTVFGLLLAPMLQREYLYSPGNLLVHTIVPLLAALDWIFLEGDYCPGYSEALWGLTAPMGYVAVILLFSFCGYRYHNGSSVPYFFMDYERLGWFRISSEGFGAFYWLIIMILAIYLIGLLLVMLRKVFCAVKSSAYRNSKTRR